MDDFSQPDWAVMGFQLERSPERRSKVKIEFFGQSDRSITFPACQTHHTHTEALQSFQVIISHWITISQGWETISVCYGNSVFTWTTLLDRRMIADLIVWGNDGMTQSDCQITSADNIVFAP